MLMWLPRLTAAHPDVAIVFVWTVTSDVIVWVQLGGPVSGAMELVRFGRPRANHSATMSNSACASRGWLPFGIDARFLNLPYSSAHVSLVLLPSPAGNACLNVSWNQPR